MRSQRLLVKGTANKSHPQNQALNILSVVSVGILLREFVFNIVPVQSMKHIKGIELLFHSFLISELDGSSCQFHASSCLSLWKKSW
jgi:hypothetical protein